ncbi:alpha/beta fold hydrolase [Marinobacter caseinilyticus]|uniref:alpha/beta fold hydrolase n=1 Tax=Marinobacter caseinilyticus TaxID=2692195 RepID=UPI00140AC3FF|nr:alpha/beta hydrolase [Marinobacter caseinilyticus]
MQGTTQNNQSVVKTPLDSPASPQAHTPPRHDLTLSLPDGRTLAYVTCGDPNGYPLLFGHGMPGSRLEALFFHEQAQAAGFQVFALDRPGIGQSTYQPNRTLLDYADDVRAFTDRLGIQRFAHLGWSSGGSRTLACAYAMPRQVSCAVLLSSYTHFEEYTAAEYPAIKRWFLSTGLPGPAMLKGSLWLFRLVVMLMAGCARIRPNAYMNKVWRLASEDDRAILAQPRLWALFRQDQRECFTSSGWAIARDLETELAHWGFQLAEVGLPIDLFQGSDDPFTPQSFCDHLARRLPRATVHPLSGRGHLYPLDAQFQQTLFAHIRRRLAADASA